MAKDWLQIYGPQALEQFYIGCLIIDNQGICRYVNDSAQKYIGLPIDELIGEHIHKMVHSQQKSNHTWRSCYLLEPLQTGKTIVRKPDMLWSNNGKGFWTDFSVFPIKDAQGRPEALLISFIPGEVALKAIEEHEENIKKFRAVFDVSSDAQLILDTKGNIIDANRATIRLFHRDTLVNESLFRLVDKESQKTLRDFWRKVIKEETQQTLAIPLKIDKSDYYVDLSVYTNMLPGQHLLVIHDVTSKTIDIKLRERFVATVGHELKTPLTVIKAYSQLIRKRLRPGGNDKVFRYLETVDDKANLLTQLINTMMDFIKFGVNKIAFDDEEIEWQSLVSEITEELQRTTSKVRFILRGQCNSIIFADRFRVTQLLTNILNNARKYSPENSEVFITIFEDKNWVCVSVKDSGVGMSRKDMEHIYEPFFRSKSSEANNSPGLGLGLFLAKQLLTHYGGEIIVKSELSKGSEFTIKFPRK